jgi:hypothetical protein
MEAIPGKRGRDIERKSVEGGSDERARNVRSQTPRELHLDAGGKEILK